MSHKTDILCHIVFLLCLLAACSDNSALLSESFLCIDADCSIGIFTGPITRHQAKTLLTDKYGTDNVRTDGGKWHTQSGTGYVEFGKDNIESRFYLEQGMLTIENLINQIGEPSFVHVVRAFSQDYPCAGSNVLYPEHGVVVIFYPDNGTIGITPDQAVAGVEFMPVIASGQIVPTDTWVVDWQGYQDYCELVTNPTATPGS